MLIYVNWKIFSLFFSGLLNWISPYRRNLIQMLLTALNTNSPREKEGLDTFWPKNILMSKNTAGQLDKLISMLVVGSSKLTSFAFGFTDVRIIHKSAQTQSVCFCITIPDTWLERRPLQRMKVTNQVIAFNTRHNCPHSNNFSYIPSIFLLKICDFFQVKPNQLT